MNATDSETVTGELPATAGAPHTFPVVGIGASAGGIEPLKQFFGLMPADSGMAFVVVLHLSQEHESHLAEILQSMTSMRVTEVRETLTVERNTVYVIPPTKHLRMVDGVIVLVEPEQTRGRRVPIDLLFSTLAEAYQRLGICIVLSGTGTDGTVGLRSIKEHGGLAIVQDPEEAEYDAMPRSAIDTRLADVVLPVGEMPARLLSIKSFSELISIPDEDAAISGLPAFRMTAIRDILTLLRNSTGHDFSSYKRPTMIRRIARRMQVHGLSTATDYLQFLGENPDAVDSLLQDLLISVTRFFRDPATFDVIERDVVPELFTGKSGRDHVRVWVTACATGEEVYSLAMLLCEYAERLEDPPKIQIFASDLDRSAIAIARRCVYPDTIAADITPERLERFFDNEGDHYRVRQSLRDLVLFSHHNLLHDPPFCQIDLVSCRNLLIYLNHETQERILETFHFALRRDGVLFLGSSESAETHPRLFAALYGAHRIYRARPGAATFSPQPSLSAYGGHHNERHEESTGQRTGLASYGALHHRLVEHYAPPSLLVDEDLVIVHVSTSAGRFLHVAGGEPTQDLLKAVHPDLRSDLRTAMIEAKRETRVETGPITVRLDAGSTSIILRVRCLDDIDTSRPFFLVVFDEHAEPVIARHAGPAVDGETDRESYIRQLENELEGAWSRLRAPRVPHGSSDEELMAENQEQQSIIEELRSASEELETSKEELQSVNEELITVNQELKETIDEVSRSHANVQNLMASTDIATIFLDTELRIELYTPIATRLFNILPVDIGRPLAHLTHSIVYDRLTEDATAVLGTHLPIEREVRDLEGRAYIARFLPYRTVHGQIEGVVLTFIDISDRKVAEESRSWLSSIVSSSNDAIISFTPDTKIVSWNAAAERLFGYTADEALDQSFAATIAPESGHDHAEIMEILVQARTMTNFETVLRRKDGKTVDVSVSISPIHENGGSSLGVTAIVQDIGERKRVQQMLRDADRRKDTFLATLAHELRNPLAPVLSGLEIIGATPDDPGMVTMMVEVMKRQTLQLIHLVDDLLDVSRITQGKIQLKKEHIELATAVDMAVEASHRLITEAGLSLAITLPAGPVYLDADLTRVTQVITNLLTNSAKFTESGGEIAVTAEIVDDMIEIRVRDTGIGIPPEMLSEVFVMFNQIEGHHGAASTGLGIGLSLVRQLVEIHGGTVAAFSNGEGMGSEFVVSLPLSSRQQPSATPQDPQRSVAAPEASAREHRVLVVDDNTDAADMLGIMLMRDNHTVRTAYDGTTAIATAIEFRPDICLLDIGLPDINGHDVARTLRQELPAITMIAVTGWGHEKDHRLSSEAGFDHYLLKPVTVQDLRALLV